MAITAIEYALFSYYKQNGGLPENPNVLELGEARWYGDLPPEQLARDIEALVPDQVTKSRLLAEFETTIQNQDGNTMRKLAQVFYTVFLNPKSVTAIDPYGSETALHLDLNDPVELDGQFDLCLDFGTAEYVFNTHQFFKNVHQLTKPGGVMVHGTSLSGWYEQGLFSIKPTLFWNLAEKNGYEIMAFVYAELHPLKLLEIPSPEDFIALVKEQMIAAESLLYVFLRKSASETDFVGIGR